MKVVLAEKPSVARDIAAVLGAKTKRDGYFQGNDYCVTYAFGHLVTIAEPEDMNPVWGKPWRLQQLPMIPDSWKYRVAQNANTQFKVIKKLFSDPATTSIICATDAGREGEHIFRLIYRLTGSKKPVQRLWISSLTADAIREGFRKLKPSADFDNLASAAAGRAHADWIVGLNFTRAYTVINSQLCTIGRVQTPTLALIVERQKAIDNFTPTKFFEILVTFEPGFGAYYITPGKDPQTRLPDKQSAQDVINAIGNERSGVVASVITTQKKNKAPALYNLLTLQKDANRVYGYTAQETLDTAQSLYEGHKAISYPRTESRHLSTDMIDELPRILSAVLSFAPAHARQMLAQEGIKPGNITADLIRPMLGKSYVDDTKLTDHHAIIPTGASSGGGFSTKQENVYRLIVMRFLSIFMPPEICHETTAILTIGPHSFRARGIVVKQTGWKALYPKSKGKDSDDESNENAQELPPLAKGQPVPKRKEELKEGKTTAPKPYDDASLLSAMKNVGQDLDDEDLAAYMKQSGLGTPATRAAIIERLLQTGYIERVKKTLVPTVKGSAIIDAVHSNLKNASMTATWEQQLADVQEGKLTVGKFEDEIAGFVRKLLADVTKAGASLPAVPPMSPSSFGGGGPSRGTGAFSPASRRTDASSPAKASVPQSLRSPKSNSAGAGAVAGIGPCPKCKQGIVRQTPKGAGCSRWQEGCNMSIWREQYGKRLTDSQIKDLVVKGRTKTIKKFKKKDGSGTYDAALIISDDFRVRLEFGRTSSSPMPEKKMAAGTKPKHHKSAGDQPAKGKSTNGKPPKGKLTDGKLTNGRSASDGSVMGGRTGPDSANLLPTYLVPVNPLPVDNRAKNRNESAENADNIALGKCPQCGRGVVRSSSRGAGCGRWKEGCTFSIWRTQYGKDIADEDIRELIEKRRTKPIHGFVRRDGSGTYDARLILSDDFKVRLQFDTL